MASKRRLRRRYGCAARRPHHNIQKCCKDKQAFVGSPGTELEFAL